MLGNFSRFCRRLMTFFKINLFKKFFQEHYQSVKRFESNQDRHCVGPDLGPNCLQTTKVATSKERVNYPIACAKAQADISSEPRGLNFYLILQRHPYLVFTSSKGSDEPAQLHRLV